MQDLKTALITKDIQSLVEILRRLFCQVPYQLDSKKERFYHGILQTIFYLIGGIKAQSEYSIGHGHIDIVLELPQLIYIIEIKLNESAEFALAQIEAKRYWEPFLKYEKPILLLGLSFKRGPGTFDITYAMKDLSKIT